MIRFLCASMILIVGCQNSWTSQEQADFISRCIKYKPDSKTLNSHKEFCNCILMESINLNLSYSQFLEIESNSSNTEFILGSCIELF